MFLINKYEYKRVKTVYAMSFKKYILRLEDPGRSINKLEQEPLKKSYGSADLGSGVMTIVS